MYNPSNFIISFNHDSLIKLVTNDTTNLIFQI